jgi:hypothetical protein
VKLTQSGQVCTSISVYQQVPARIALARVLRLITKRRDARRASKRRNPSTTLPAVRKSTD